MSHKSNIKSDQSNDFVVKTLSVILKCAENNGITMIMMYNFIGKQAITIDNSLKAKLKILVVQRIRSEIHRFTNC